MPATSRIQLPERPDPKKVILDKLKDVPGITIASNELLMAVYQRDELSPGGIIQTAKTLKEDVYQGKVGLVVKIGENFRHKWSDPYTGESGGIPISLHDWIVIRASDTLPIEINVRDGVYAKEGFVVCRLVLAKYIRMIVTNPDSVW